MVAFLAGRLFPFQEIEQFAPPHFAGRGLHLSSGQQICAFRQLAKGYILMVYITWRGLSWLEQGLPSCFAMGAARRCGCHASFALRAVKYACDRSRKESCWNLSFLILLNGSPNWTGLIPKNLCEVPAISLGLRAAKSLSDRQRCKGSEPNARL